LWARSRVRETETKLVWKQGFSRRIFVLKLLGEKMVALSQLFPTRAPQLSDDLSSGQCSKSGYGVAVVEQRSKTSKWATKQQERCPSRVLTATAMAATIANCATQPEPQGRKARQMRADRSLSGCSHAPWQTFRARQKLMSSRASEPIQRKMLSQVPRRKSRSNRDWFRRGHRDWF